MKKHLGEYLRGKYCDCNDIPVRFPDTSDLYHVLFDLMSRRPACHPIDNGTIEIVLPDRRCGKDPAYYNYMGERSQAIFERKVEIMFYAELHDYADTQKHIDGIDYGESVFLFMRMYDITGITEDALVKNYYRWRKKVRKKRKAREYKRY